MGKNKDFVADWLNDNGLGKLVDIFKGMLCDLLFILKYVQ